MLFYFPFSLFSFSLPFRFSSSLLSFFSFGFLLLLLSSFSFFFTCGCTRVGCLRILHGGGEACRSSKINGEFLAGDEVSNQMLELYEQNRTAPSHGNETEGSSASVVNHRAPPKASSAIEETPSQNQTAGNSSLHTDRQNPTQRLSQNERNDNDSKESKDRRHHEPGNASEGPIEDPVETNQSREKSSGHNEGPKSYSPLDAIKKIDKDKVKAALEKRRKERSEVARKMDVMDDDDLIERELESGIELATEEDKVKQERRQSWSKYKQEHKNQDHGIENGELVTEKEIENAEEGEFHSPEPSSRKRKDYDYQNQYPPSKYRDSDDSRAMGRLERAERDHKRIRQENHV